MIPEGLPGHHSGWPIIVWIGMPTLASGVPLFRDGPFQKPYNGRMKFDLLIIFLFGLIWFGIIMILRTKKSRVFLVFFTVFYIYLVMVLYYTLFQFQSLILLKLFNPHLMLNGFAAGKELNLIPLVTLTPGDMQTSLLNILMMAPFGFILPFIADYRMKKVVVSAMLFSLAIELTQWLTGRLAGVTFRVADVNDVIFNTLGAAVGYVLFLGFGVMFRRMAHRWEGSTNAVVGYVNERVGDK
jgi:glycopeptide antibiotics resistance protein